MILLAIAGFFFGRALLPKKRLRGPCYALQVLAVAPLRSATAVGFSLLSLPRDNSFNKEI
jgi:hypothetical protein